jgi:phosphoribosyl 1,2-cyclic phosphodiesterase
VEITVLGSGSSGNAIVIKKGQDILLIDAGFSGVELSRRLEKAKINQNDIRAILISHEHDDHIQGARIFAKRLGNIPMYANLLTAERLKLMNKAPAKMNIFSNGSLFNVGPFAVDAFSVCHDAVDPVGFVIAGDGKKVGIATDLGYTGKMVPLKLFDSEIIILESNHDPDLLRRSNRPAHLQHRILGRRGHLCNAKAAEILPEVIGPKTKYLILAHVSDDCNDVGLVRNIMKEKLDTFNRTDVKVIVARQNQISETIII